MDAEAAIGTTCLHMDMSDAVGVLVESAARPARRRRPGSSRAASWGSGRSYTPPSATRAAWRLAVASAAVASGRPNVEIVVERGDISARSA